MPQRRGSTATKSKEGATSVSGAKGPRADHPGEETETRDWAPELGGHLAGGRGFRGSGWRWTHAALAVGALTMALVFAFALGPTGALITALLALLAASGIAVLMLIRHNRALDRQRLRDELTGLPNQLAFWRTAAAAVPASDGKPLSLICVEIDHHKELTGLYGHLASDAMLARLAGLMEGVAPHEATCFRCGDSELLMLAPGCDEQAAVAVAEQVRTAVQSLPESSPEFTVSAGVASMTGGRQAAELVMAAKLFDEAERALRVATRGGRGRVVASTSPEVRDFDLLDPEIEAARRAAIEMARATLGARHAETASHSDAVVELAQVIGQSLGLDPDERENLQLAAGLHDIGKIAMPREILNKPGPLDEDEWALVKEHTVIGERILRSVPELAPAADVVRHAHERWDGAGYPDGLAGEQIPLCSRIVFCADAFHAIRSDRPYRAGRSSTAALDEVRANAGTQFDPDVVAALERVAAAARRRGARFSRRTLALLATVVVLLAAAALAAITGVIDVPLIGSAGGAGDRAQPGDAKSAPDKGDSHKGGSHKGGSKKKDGDGRGASSGRGDGRSEGSGSQGNAYAYGQDPGIPGRGVASGQGSGGGRSHP